MKIEIKGAYLVDAPEQCHLIEVLITQYTGPVDIGQFTQEWPGKEKSSWQVPWDERVLDADGREDVLGRFPSDVVVDGQLRVAFFFHYLDCDRPLITPGGRVPLPPATVRPKRLDFLEYEPPC